MSLFPILQRQLSRETVNLGKSISRKSMMPVILSVRYPTDILNGYYFYMTPDRVLHYDNNSLPRGLKQVAISCKEASEYI